MTVRMIPIAAPVLDEVTIKAVTEVLGSGALAQGLRVARFEEEFASYIGTRHAVATSSGTAALHTALLASGIGYGDEVITTPFSFIASANAILFCRAKPVFVDIDENTFNIKPDLIAEKITPKTKAVVAVHLYGQPCDMKEIASICNQNNLVLIEDACQAHGARYAGRKVGSFGTGCFSFYPTKNMTTGEGGMITTNEEGVAEKARMIRDHGQKERYLHQILGYNYRMTDIAAAIGICQLKRLDGFNQERIENAAFLADGIGKIKGLVPPLVAPEARHVFHQFTIKVTPDFGISRDEFKAKLRNKGVGCEVYYPLPIHQQPYYQRLGYGKEHLSNSGKAAREVLSVPVHPSLTRGELDYIVQAIKNI